MTKEQEKGYFNWKEQADDGSYYDDIQLYGMDAFPLQKVKGAQRRCHSSGSGECHCGSLYAG